MIIHQDELLRAGREYNLLSVISFEQRGTAVLRNLLNAQISIDKAWIFDYRTTAVPEGLDIKLREKQRASYFKSIKNDNLKLIKDTNPFAHNTLHSVMREIISNYDDHRPLLIDITCMTRVHQIVLASILADTQHDTVNRIYFGYSSPVSYGFENDVISGWKDVLFVPISKAGHLVREGHARGLVLVGHDAERLSVSLQDLEPGTGLVVYSNTEMRPDFLSKARDANKEIVDRLLSLKLPLDPDQDMNGPGWDHVRIDIMDLERAKQIAVDEIQYARTNNSPLILYPFGPKPISLVMANEIAKAKGIESWAVYPIPNKFLAYYTRGTGKTSYFQINPD